VSQRARPRPASSSPRCRPRLLRLGAARCCGGAAGLTAAGPCARRRWRGRAVWRGAAGRGAARLGAAVNPCVRRGGGSRARPRTTAGGGTEEAACWVPVTRVPHRVCVLPCPDKARLLFVLLVTGQYRLLSFTQWLGLEGILKPTQPQPLPWVGLPPSSSGCPGPHPAWP